MDTVCKVNQCTGCGACQNVCPVNCIQIFDSVKDLNAVIDTTRCIKCGLCEKVCQIRNPVNTKEPLYLKQGWAMNELIREEASSGGFASAIEESFMSKGGIVCSCKFSEGNFSYHIAKTKEELRGFSGSKYVKSDLMSVYDTLKEYLNAGDEVLFIGLPCHSAAIQKYISPQIKDRLYTVDLICHGTPSIKLLRIFIEQYNINLPDIADIKFRNKESFGLSEESMYIDMPGIMDPYTLAFMYGLSYTDNCYYCQYAQLGRVSDLTLGDSWGSNLSEADRKKGVSLVLCQTKKGEELLQNANLKLLPVDMKKAIANNEQLQHPSVAPKTRDTFFDDIKSGKSIKRAVFVALPKYYIKQRIKGYLIQLGIKRGGGTE